MLLGDNDAHAKNVAILHLPGRSVLADVYDAVTNLFQSGRIDDKLALAIDGSFDHRRISAAHLIREAGRWNALGTGEAERIVTATLADFAKALDCVTVPPGVPAPTAAQLAWNVERLQAGGRSASSRAVTIEDAVVLDPKYTTSANGEASEPFSLTGYGNALLGTHREPSGQGPEA